MYIGLKKAWGFGLRTLCGSEGKDYLTIVSAVRVLLIMESCASAVCRYSP